MSMVGSSEASLSPVVLVSSSECFGVLWFALLVWLLVFGILDLFMTLCRLSYVSCTSFGSLFFTNSR